MVPAPDRSLDYNPELSVLEPRLILCTSPSQVVEVVSDDCTIVADDAVPEGRAGFQRLTGHCAILPSFLCLNPPPPQVVETVSGDCTIVADES